MNISQLLKAFKKDERGVTAIEYGLIGVAMAALLAVALSSKDGSILAGLAESYDNIATDIGTVGTAADAAREGKLIGDGN